MANKVRFAFTEVDPSLGALSTLPYLPLTLTYQNQFLSVSGLLDTGSSVNVLPYEMGLALGAVWENQRLPLPLGGNLARFEARALVVKATVEQFPAVDLAFAWTQDKYAPSTQLNLKKLCMCYTLFKKSLSMELQRLNKILN